MIKRPVRDLQSDKPNPPRFCDVIINDEGEAYLEKKVKDKKGKSTYDTIAWEDVVYQVEAARGKAANK